MDRRGEQRGGRPYPGVQGLGGAERAPSGAVALAEIGRYRGNNASQLVRTLTGGVESNDLGRNTVLLRLLFLFIALAAPASAIVVGYNPFGCTSPGTPPGCSSTLGNPDASPYTVTFNQVTDGVNLNGEVALDVTYNNNPALGDTCSGSLLSDGETILTAGHCLDRPGYVATSVTVYFDQACGWFCNPAPITNPADFIVDPGWVADGFNVAYGNDLGVVKLPYTAPSSSQGYSLYSGVLPIGDTILMVGAGQSGQGEIDGADYPQDVTGGGYMRAGQNTYVGTCDAVLGPTSCTSTIFLSQFYASNPVADQVEIAGGDSGGGSFYNGQLVGVHDFDYCPDSATCSIDASQSYSGDVSVVGGDNAAWIASVEFDSAPEPGSVALTALGAAAFALLRRRRARRSA